MCNPTQHELSNKKKKQISQIHEKWIIPRK